MEITVDIDDIVFSCNKREKKELYQALIADGDCLEDNEKRVKETEEKLREEFLLMETLQAMDPYELKKTLCTLLGVSSYNDVAALRTALEPIINA